MSFRAGSDESSIAHVNIDSKCKNPVAIAYSDIDSILCGTSCGPVTCPNSPASTSVDIDSYVTSLTNSGFDVRLKAVDGVWPAAAAYPVTYHIICGQSDTPAPGIKKGIVNVYYTNGLNDSSVATVSLPIGCVNPAIFTQSYTVNLNCGTGSGARRCLNDSQALTTDLRSYVTNVTSSNFGVHLSTENSVWVGAISPAFQIGYYVRCESIIPP